MLLCRGNGQLDDVTLPKEANHQILPWFKPADTGINLIVAATLFHRNLIHTQNNISAENEFFAFDIRSQFSGMYSPAPGNRSFRHALNKHAGWLRQIKCPCEIAVDKKTFNTRPERFLLKQQPSSRVGSCGESQTLRAPRPAHDVADNSHD